MFAFSSARWPGVLAVLLCITQGCSNDSLDPDEPFTSPDGRVQEPSTSSADGGAAPGMLQDAGQGPVTDAGPSGATPDATVSRPADGGVTSPSRDATVNGPDGTASPSDATVGPSDADVPDGAQGTPSSANSTIVPHASWTCMMPNGIPPPEMGTLAFTAEFAVTMQREVGVTQFGQRQLTEFGTGSATGPKLQASLMKGGFELLVTLSNGSVELEQILMLQAGSANIYLRVCGVSPSANDPVRVVMDFEAPNASHGALNTLKLVGVRELSADKKKLTLRVYDVSQVAPPASSVRIEKAAGARSQSWECITLEGQNGAEIYRETVNIGGSVSVGASKRGNRNVIPITGGTTSGKVKGKVLPLGADFQLLGSPFIIDARYVMLSDDNELIIVRNCGAVGKLVPVFEARADGPYGWINEDRWLSSNPSIGLGSVSLTIYEKR